MTLHRKQCVFGVKQTARAVKDGRASTVYLAQDASPLIVEPVVRLAEEQKLDVIDVPTMRELGAMCGLDVKCSCAAELQMAGSKS